MKQLIYMIVLLILVHSDQYAQQVEKTVNLQIKLVSADTKEIVAGATILQKSRKINTTSGEDGFFSFEASTFPDTLLISHGSFSMKSVIIRFPAEIPSIIQLDKYSRMMDEVIVSTGFEKIPKERATGSFNFVDNKLINRSVSTNIIDRLENVVPGVIFNKGAAANPDPLLIRGRSTLFANAAPLIVIDNFPYDGNLDNINPNDIESITILKDAAAASIWGARAGNGVIVLTTKRGKSGKPKVELNANLTFQKRPDLSNVSNISSSDYIDLEKFLFSNNHYFSDEFFDQLNFGHPPLTPVVELLIAKRDGTIDPSEADAQIESMKQYDVKKDLSKYMYQNSLKQQYALNVSGNTNSINYYFSVGFDKNAASFTGYDYNRISLRNQTTFRVTDRFNISTGINFLQSINESGNYYGDGYYSPGSKYYYPYARLVDDEGNPLPVSFSMRNRFITSASDAGLLDWSLSPVNDLDQVSRKDKLRDYLINMGTTYDIGHGFNSEVKYQYENQLSNGLHWYKEDSYFTRNKINAYTQVNASGELEFPIPKGGITDNYHSETVSQQVRGQLNYNNTFREKHALAAIIGGEIRSLKTTGGQYRLYGYDPEISVTEGRIDYITNFPHYDNPYYISPIENPQGTFKRQDNFLSMFANLAYTYNERLILSVSGRKDEANLFGVRANQKGTPLWSVGAAWILSKEKFYGINWLPMLKLRATYGVNGNISRQASANTTAFYLNSHSTGATSLSIINGPNESLSWEKINMLNLGLDFELRNKIAWGTIEFYQKNSDNLLGQAPLDPTLGQTSYGQQSYFFGNVAGMSGKGMDLELNTKNLDRKLKWITTFLFSKNNTKITDYLMPVSTSGQTYVLNSALVNPIVGKPVFSIFSFPWRGLNTENGDPMGFVGGKNSTDYSAIFNNSPLDSLTYNGPAQPTHYGAIRNTFSWKNVSLSFNISFKYGYYFRKESLSYVNLFGSWNGHGEYADRWQQPGDENLTNVPSLIYPANGLRDIFYNYADLHVVKGDHIRFEDVSFSYDFNKQQWKKLPFQNMRFYFYTSNLGVLWYANKDKIDPYYNNTPANAKTFSIGLNIQF
jgi:TonB-linked SusC/RagA family outer membrane protein